MSKAKNTKQLEKRIAELEEALKPFAELWDEHGYEHMYAVVHGPLWTAQVSRFPFWRAHEVLQAADACNQ